MLEVGFEPLGTNSIWMRMNELPEISRRGNFGTKMPAHFQNIKYFEIHLCFFEEYHLVETR